MTERKVVSLALSDNQLSELRVALGLRVLKLKERQIENPKDATAYARSMDALRGILEQLRTPEV